MPAQPDEHLRATPQPDGTRGAAPPAAASDVPQAVPVAPGPLPALPGFEIQKEIARGGSSIVYAARQAALDREVAIKTLIPGRPLEADDVRRFDTEARITARLLHPAIPPVFAVGRFPDNRPFMVMKRVHGRDLGSLLKERPSPAHGLTRLIAAFEQICQAVGFAHSRSVIHRDLKPSNVLIGEFGEVQVVDWGLAKETDSGPWGVGVEQTGRLVSGRQGQAGRPLGTPAYMAPEQAKGDWDRVGPWSDVFALGGVLADILTGKPPFHADTPFAALALSGNGAVTDCFARLDACAADPQLIAIAKRCLAPEPQHRPNDAKALADAVAAYRAGIEARLRKAEAERLATVAKEQEVVTRVAVEVEAKQAAEDRVAEAERRTKAEQATVAALRKGRLVQMLIAGAVGLLLLGVAVAGWVREPKPGATSANPKGAGKDEADTKPAAPDTRARDGARAALAQAVELRKQRKFREATDAITQAGKFAPVPDDVVAAVRRERDDIAFARELDEIRGKHALWIPSPVGDAGRLAQDGVAEAYSTAFARRGLAIGAQADLSAVAKKIADSPIRDEMLRALDDWALHEKSQEAFDRVFDVASKVSPSDPAAPFRDPATRRNPPKQVQIQEISESVPATLLLAAIIQRQKGDDAHPILAVAQAKHPQDFDVALALAVWHHAYATRRVPSNQVEGHLRRAVYHYQTARALRPDHLAVMSNLGLLLQLTGEPQAALVVLREAVRLYPNEFVPHYGLGHVLGAMGQIGPAVQEFRLAAQVNPGFAPAFAAIGTALSVPKQPNEPEPNFRQRLKEAEGAFQQSLKLDGNQPIALTDYGHLLVFQGQHDSAISHFRRAIERAPNLAHAHYGLGLALEAKKDPEAEASFKQAVKLDPKRYPELAKKYPPEEKK